MAPLLPSAPADRVAWGCLALAALGVIGTLAQYWGANPGHADRLLILVGAAWAAYKLAPGRSALPASPRPFLGFPLLIIASMAFPIGVFLFVQIGPRTLVLWWLAIALATAAAGLVLSRLGWSHLRASAFPIAYPFFALPIPLRILNPLQDHLQEITTAAAQIALSGLGFDVAREEFVLALPGGKLRVEEACSGVRSITALTAIAAFVAFLRGFGPLRGTVLVALAIPIVAAVNVLRVVLCGLIQEAIGPDYIQGNWHEVLGFAVVLVGLLAILGLARLLGRKAEIAPTTMVLRERTPGGWIAARVLIAAGIGTVGLVFAGREAEARAATTAPLADIAPRFGPWTSTEEPVPPVVTDLLAPDVALHRRYEDNVGHVAEVWAFYWTTGSAIKGYHHPDVCWGNKGFRPTERWVEVVSVPNGGSVAVTAREFRQGRTSQIVLYWTQEGRRVWTADDERAAVNDMLASPWSGHSWVGDFLGASLHEAGPRLAVVVVAPSAGASERKAAVALLRQFAADLYRLCPWAKPESTGVN